mgnify:FL=1
MMKVAVLVLLCAVSINACSNLQRLKVKSQWSQAFGFSTDREAFGTALWKAIFAQAPESRDLFKRVNGDDVTSPDFQAHSSRVLSALDQCISLLDDQDTLDAQLSHLNGQHDDRNIPSNYFNVMGEAIMQVVPAQLGRCFDRDAWAACFDVIAQGIKA